MIETKRLFSIPEAIFYLKNKHNKVLINFNDFK